MSAVNEPELAVQVSARAIPLLKNDQPLKKEPPDFGLFSVEQSTKFENLPPSILKNGRSFKKKQGPEGFLQKSVIFAWPIFSILEAAKANDLSKNLRDKVSDNQNFSESLKIADKDDENNLDEELDQVNCESSVLRNSTCSVLKTKVCDQLSGPEDVKSEDDAKLGDRDGGKSDSTRKETSPSTGCQNFCNSPSTSPLLSTPTSPRPIFLCDFSEGTVPKLCEDQSCEKESHDFGKIPCDRIFSGMSLPIGLLSKFKLRKENLYPGAITMFEKCGKIFEQVVGPNPLNFALAKISVLNFDRDFSQFQPFLSPVPNCLPLDGVSKTNKENLDPGIFGVKFQQV